METEREGYLPFFDTKLTQEDGTRNITWLKTDADRQVLALQLPPSAECKERSCFKSLFDGDRNITLQKGDQHEVHSSTMAALYKSFTLSPPPYKKLHAYTTTRGRDGIRNGRRKILAEILYVNGVSERIKKAKVVF